MQYYFLQIFHNDFIYHNFLSQMFSIKLCMLKNKLLSNIYCDLEQVQSPFSSLGFIQIQQHRKQTGEQIQIRYIFRAKSKEIHKGVVKCCEAQESSASLNSIFIEGILTGPQKEYPKPHPQMEYYLPSSIHTSY